MNLYERYRTYCGRYGLPAPDSLEPGGELIVAQEPVLGVYYVEVVYDTDTENLWAFGHRWMNGEPDDEVLFEHPVPMGVFEFMDSLEYEDARGFLCGIILHSLAEYGYL